MASNSLVNRPHGGAILVVDTAGEIRINSGGLITAAGTQAAHIANATGGTYSATGAQVTINAILTALEGVGILATS